MTLKRSASLTLAAAALMGLTAASHAAITVTTTGTVAAFNTAIGGSIDSFNDLTINTDLGAISISRSTPAGIGYSLSSSLSDASLGTSSLFVVPVAGFVAVSTGVSADTLSLSNFAAPVYAVGGNFYRSNVLGEVSSGGVVVVARDINGLSVSQTLSAGSLNSFVGFRSDVALSSVVVSLSTASTDAYVTLDNITAAVPESSTWLLMLLGGAAVLGLVARRRA